MDQINVSITSRETIKPSSPTPLNLKHFKLSLLDQLSPAAYVPMIIYYAPTPDSSDIKIQKRVHLLKKSLSETLTEFYPLAGRVKENSFIDCNDDGVDFIEARVNFPLSRIIQQPEAEIIDQFLPQEYHVPSNSSPIVLQSQVAVQVNIFSCGGIAIGTCISHKLVDGITFTCFMNMWASKARTASGKHFSPFFIGPHLFPAKDLSAALPVLNIPQAKNVTKRFVFDMQKIAFLRERVLENSCVTRPSRVELVSALIWKCAVDASRTKSAGSKTKTSTSFLTQTVNLRAKMDPPLPESAAGNLLWLAMAQEPNEGAEIGEFVCQVQKGLEKFDSEYVRKIQGEDGFLVLSETLKQIGELVSKDVEIYRCTSLRKSQVYEADFGWGKPVWVSSAGLTFKNVVFLIESRDGNRIEAWVTLDEHEMAIFERNQELLSFDSTVQDASFLQLNSRL
ncbi:stemmadenine O-acetyltransferase-like [Euphorbia lathyris]|uniref:stemmadenine O-acetyltransferase-like n=1 Tax=Euphorbia lathyris TaxID=212925 RepID=UPI0033136962